MFNRFFAWFIRYLPCIVELHAQVVITRFVVLVIRRFDCGPFLWLVQLKAQEITNIVNAFNDSSNLAQSGLFLGGTKFLVIQGEQGVVIRGKKVYF